jgi:hypothetical protein
MLEPDVGLEAAVVDEEQVAAGERPGGVAAPGLDPGRDLEAGSGGEVGRSFAGGFGEGHVRERTQPFNEAVAVDVDVDLLDAADLGHLEDVHGKVVEYLVGEHAADHRRAREIRRPLDRSGCLSKAPSLPVPDAVEAFDELPP